MRPKIETRKWGTLFIEWKGSPLGEARVFDVEFKVGVAHRLVNGESLTALHREYGIKRSVLYRWRNAYQKDGEAGLSRPRGRPPGSGTKVAAAARLVEPLGQTLQPEVKQDTAAKRIAELERVIGKQTLQIDFLSKAFKQVEELRRNNKPSGATASTERSEP